MDDKPLHVFSVMAGVGLTTVHLYAETLDHVKERHPEVQPLLPSIVLAVEAAIVGPDHIEQDRPNAYVFVSQSSTNAEGDPLRVAIKVVGGTTSGRVSTFYFASTDYVPNYVWRKDDA